MNKNKDTRVPRRTAFASVLLMTFSPSAAAHVAERRAHEPLKQAAGVGQSSDSSGAPAASGNTAASTGGSFPGAAPDSPNFDLARTIRDAQASSTDIANARLAVQEDQRATDAAEAAARPQVNGSASATRYDAVTIVSLGSTSFQELGYNAQTLQLAITQKIDILGDVRATRSQLKMDEAADRSELDRITNARILSAKSTYFNLLRAIHQAEVAESALRNALEQQRISSVLYLGEIGAHIDLLSANTQVAQARQTLQKDQNQRNTSRVAFNYLVGRPMTSPVALVDTPGVTMGVDLPPSLLAGPVGSPISPSPGAAPIFKPFAAPIDKVNAIDVERSVNTGLTMRPEIMRDTVRIRAAETGIRIARTDGEPTFNISATGDYYPTTSFQSPRQKTAALTATITFPFYDGGATRSNVAKAKLERDSARTNLDATRTNISQAVRTDYLNLLTAAQEIASANSALEGAVAQRQLAQVRYEGQVGLYLEVTQAQSALVSAENDQVGAVYDYFVALATFEDAMGTPSMLPDPTFVQGPLLAVIP